MKLNKRQLRQLIKKEHKNSLNEQVGAITAAGVALSILTSMLVSREGRQGLANILLLIPNLIDGLCESVFPEEDQSGSMLSNLKTKLCKLTGYTLATPLTLLMKIVAELLLMMNDTTAKVVIDEVNKTTPPKTPAIPAIPEPAASVDTGSGIDLDIPELVIDPVSSTDVYNSSPGSEYYNPLDMPYEPVINKVAESVNRSKLRKLILQEFQKMNETSYGGARKGSMARRSGHGAVDYLHGDIGGDEVFEDSGDEEGRHYHDNAEADRYDMQHDIEAGDSRKHLDRLAKDIEYDDEHIKKEYSLSEVYDDDIELNTDQLHYTSTLEEDYMEEVVNVDSTDDNDPGWNSMSAADTQAEAEKEAGPLNIGENTEGLSRGSLYRRRYYGRY